MDAGNPSSTTDLLSQIIALLSSQAKGPNLTLSPPGATITQPTMPSGTAINQLAPTYPLNIIGLCDRWNAVTFAISGPGTATGNSSTLNSSAGAFGAATTSLIVANPFQFPAGGPFTILIDSEQLTVTQIEDAAASTLTGSISPDDTTLAVASATGYPTSAPFIVTIGSEQLAVTLVAGTTFTVTRGANFTTPATHAGGQVVHCSKFDVTRGVNGTIAAAHSNSAAVTQYFGTPSVDLVILEADTNLGPFYPIADNSGNSAGYSGVWQGLVNGQAIVANVSKPYYTAQVYAVTGIALGWGATIDSALNNASVSFAATPTTATNPAPGFIITVDQEQMLVTNFSTASGPCTVTVRRGYNNSTAAAHNAGSLVQQIFQPQGFKIVATPFGPSSKESVQLSNTVPVSLFKLRDLTAVQSVKASPGVLFAVHVENNQGAAAWIQIFNLAAGSVVLGTTAPTWEKLVAANGSADIILPANGTPFSAAIAMASTTGEKGATPSASGVQVFGAYS